ncbi:MAG TPA: pyridoxamine 5'-phosphate oxidase [bacterium]|nr:pyridoxamine 5'-phosphate oxidase [bacterium]
MDRNPIRQFQLWFREAAASGIPLPEAACLSTVGPKGSPEGRMILLKGADAKGFVFYTNLKSAKASSLRKRPQAALTFYWEKFRRQVRVSGKVTAVSKAEADAYFRSRPRESRLGAWASDQSAVLDSRETLERRFDEFERKFEGKDVPRPPFWSGFRIVPDAVEFWIERPRRLHDRFLYRRKGSKWTVARLFP